MTVGNFLPSIIAGGPEHIGKYVAAVTAPVVYTFVFAELVLRPLKHRLA